MCYIEKLNTCKDKNTLEQIIKEMVADRYVEYDSIYDIYDSIHNSRLINALERCWKLYK